MSALLEVDDLSIRYGKVEAVRGVSLRVPHGAIVTVIGPNGAGKTTLLAAMMGLLPATGAVRFAGASIDRVEVESRVASGLVLVPERRELFTEMTVADNVLLGAYTRLRRRDASVRDDLADVYQRFPRLAERRAQLAGTLSGGERQMLALARALMTKPRLLMLDEPSLGLAPLIVRDIFTMIAGLRKEGVSILLVLEGSATELARDPRVAQSYLGIAAVTETTEVAQGAAVK